jgi:hypothetical protein
LAQCKGLGGRRGAVGQLMGRSQIDRVGVVQRLAELGARGSDYRRFMWCLAVGLPVGSSSNGINPQ